MNEGIKCIFPPPNSSQTTAYSPLNTINYIFIFALLSYQPSLPVQNHKNASPMSPSKFSKKSKKSRKPMTIEEWSKHPRNKICRFCEEPLLNVPCSCKPSCNLCGKKHFGECRKSRWTGYDYQTRVFMGA